MPTHMPGSTGEAEENTKQAFSYAHAYAGKWRGGGGKQETSNFVCPCTCVKAVGRRRKAGNKQFRMPGHLPDSSVEAEENRKQAISYARALAGKQCGGGGN